MIVCGVQGALSDISRHYHGAAPHTIITRHHYHDTLPHTIVIRRHCLVPIIHYAHTFHPVHRQHLLDTAVFYLSTDNESVIGAGYCAQVGHAYPGSGHLMPALNIIP